jgi:hypothetical protein
VLAKQAPPSAKSLTLDSLGVGRYQKNGVAEEEAKPLKLAKAFDSFDATLKLASMTNQIGEFGEYITETQKMRAYQGKITGALASDVRPSIAAVNLNDISPGGMPPELSSAMPNSEQLFDIERDGYDATNQPSNLVPILIIVLLAALAIGLAVAVALR